MTRRAYTHYIHVDGPWVREQERLGGDGATEGVVASEARRDVLGEEGACEE